MKAPETKGKVHRTLTSLIDHIERSLEEQDGQCIVFDVEGNSFCKYSDGDGNHCAVGHCMSEKYQKEVGDFQGAVTDLVATFGEEALDLVDFDSIGRQLAPLGISPLTILTEAQVIHDTIDPSYWPESFRLMREKYNNVI